MSMENRGETEIPERATAAKAKRSVRERGDRPKKKPDARSKLYQPERPFVLMSSPHLTDTGAVPTIMWTVSAALAPATLLAFLFFGWRALIVIAVAIITAVATEIVLNRMKGEAVTIKDGSAVLTGLLLALTLPPALPLSAVVIGAAFAIAIGKQIFGGLGFNIFNPALLGRAFLQACFPVAMTTWSWPETPKYALVDSITAATPLGQFKFEKVAAATNDLLIGNIGGSLGETSALAILAGGLFLIIKRHIDWRIPVGFLGTVAIGGAIFWLIDSAQHPDPVFQLLAGGLMLGAFFMATDPVTSPVTPKGTWIFAIGAGVVLLIIRLFGGLPEGVMYAILLMNAITPLLNRYTRPRFFGEAAS